MTNNSNFIVEEKKLELATISFDLASGRSDNKKYAFLQVNPDIRIIYRTITILNHESKINIDNKLVAFGCQSINYDKLKIMKNQLEGKMAYKTEVGVVNKKYKDVESIPNKQFHKWTLIEETDKFYICENGRNEVKVLLKEDYIFEERKIKTNNVLTTSFVWKGNNKENWFCYNGYELVKAEEAFIPTLINKIDYLLYIFDYVEKMKNESLVIEES